MVGCLHQVTADVEKILSQSVQGEESLRLSRGFTLSHVSLLLSGGLGRELPPVVGISAVMVNDREHNGSVRGGIYSQCGSDYVPGFTVLTLQASTDEAFSCPLIRCGWTRMSIISPSGKARWHG